MKLAAWTLFGAGAVAAAWSAGRLTPVAGQSARDYQTYKTRSLRFDLDIDPAERGKIRQIELHVSDDQGQVWNVETSVKPDQAFLAFQPKKDGAYWIKVVTVFADGSTEPRNVATAPPDQKVLVDTTNPVVRVTSAERDGSELVVNWSVEERHPNDAKTRVEYRPAGSTEADWQPVPVTGADRRSTRIRGDAGQVRVTVEDLAGNTHAAFKDFGTNSSGYTPTPVTPADAVIPLTSGPNGPKAPDLTLIQPVVGTPTELPPPARPAPVMNVAPPDTPAPIAVGSGTAPPAAVPAPEPPKPAPVVSELPPVQVINFTRFDLPYQIDAGPSGVSRIDLYLTRDDGRTWTKWSEHDGKENPLKVNLDARVSPRKEGVYGFRLVPVSGAGLSDEPPATNSVPEVRVELDETPPLIQVFQPEAHPSQRDQLVLKWAVQDKNAGKEPVTIEWSESPAGPWRPVSAGDASASGSNIVAAGGPGGGSNRVPNTGSFPWRVPTSLPTHKVHIRVTATDAAGNRSEVVTPPLLVDLVKPRARIQGVMQPTGR